MVLAAFFGPGFIFVGLISLGLTIWALVDTLSRPEWAFRAAGHSRGLWIGLEIVGLFICGLVISLIYLLAIRPSVVRAGESGYNAMTGYPTTPTTTWGTPPPPPPPWNPTPGGHEPWSAPPPPPSAVPPPPPPPSGPPAGWYPDPGGSGLRYWDGTRWTEDQRPG